MKTVAIIAEYNPFHNGHQYQMEQIRHQTNCDCLIVMLSGDYVQRGTPAMLDKHLRAEIAIHCGADIVFELPLFYATASAELFAYGAVKLLDQMSCIDYLCFGSEAGDITPLLEVAKVLDEEPSHFKELLNQKLRAGASYPTARSKALSAYFASNPLILAMIKQPNNILGIEYLKALLRLHSNIQPMTIQRKGSDYHSIEYSSSFCSATAIRSYYEADVTSRESLSLTSYLPKEAAIILKMQEQRRFPILLNDFSSLLYYKLLQENASTLQCYSDVSRELAGRLQKESLKPFLISELILKLKTKQYTYTRISRALLHILLGITTEHINLHKLDLAEPYVRLLGFRANQTKLLRSLKQKDRICLITKVADAKHVLSKPAFTSFHLELQAAHLYHQTVYQKFGTCMNNEFQSTPISIPEKSKS